MDNSPATRHSVRRRTIDNIYKLCQEMSVDADNESIQVKYRGSGSAVAFDLSPPPRTSKALPPRLLASYAVASDEPRQVNTFDEEIDADNLVVRARSFAQALVVNGITEESVDFFAADAAGRIKMLSTAHKMLNLISVLKQRCEELTTGGEKWQHQAADYQRKHELAKRDIESANDRLFQVEHTLRNLQGSHRKEVAKLKASVQEVQKKNTILQHRDRQFKSEIRKNEIQFSKLQIKLQKLASLSSKQHQGPSIIPIAPLSHELDSKATRVSTCRKVDFEYFQNSVDQYKTRMSHLEEQNAHLQDSIDYICDAVDVVCASREVAVESRDALDRGAESIVKRLQRALSTEADSRCLSCQVLRDDIDSLQAIIERQENVLNGKLFLEGDCDPDEILQRSERLSMLNEFDEESRRLAQERQKLAEERIRFEEEKLAFKEIKADRQER